MRFGTAALAALTVLAIAGCDSSGGSEASPTTTTLPSAPTAFDPCADIPQGVLDSEGLRAKTKNDNNGADGLQWRGCVWSQVDGYSATIATTNVTVDMVRARKFPDSRDFTLAGRSAISTRKDTERPSEQCNVNVQISGGSLEILLTNPSSRKKTGSLDSCALATTLTEKVVGVLPADI
ncbi:DUF3558 domain-containing protein [Nocardia sp. NPDC057353]|uniref:DUF3558 domain-containing protein n=1 Tax=Nocardia sp. NPDC057353 TaxID=3346104 RepID=UPI00363E4260